MEKSEEKNNIQQSFTMRQKENHTEPGKPSSSNQWETTEECKERATQSDVLYGRVRDCHRIQLKDDDTSDLV